MTDPTNQTSRTSGKKPVIFAWLATVLAAVAGAWYGLVAVLHGPSARYDPATALTALTVVGLIWYTFFTQQTLEHARTAAGRERGLRRNSLATGVLAELFSLTARLHNLSERGPSAGTAEFISHPMIDLAAADTNCFDAVAIHTLTGVLQRVRDVRELLDKYPALVAKAKDPTMSHNDRQDAENERATTYLAIRTRASWAYNASVDLVVTMQSRGGLMPTATGDKPVPLFQDVPLRADPFTRPTP